MMGLLEGESESEIVHEIEIEEGRWGHEVEREVEQGVRETDYEGEQGVNLW